MSDKPPKAPAPETQTSFDVFVSYAREDSEVAKRLAEKLEDRGVRCWLDTTKLQGGERWEPQIREAIDRSRSFVVVVSGSTAHSSPWVSTEWSAIQESFWRRQGVSVFPVTVGHVELPVFLRQWQTFRLNHPAESVDGITASISAQLTAGLEKQPDQKEGDREIAAKRFREIERVLKAGGDEGGDPSSDG